MLCAVVVREGEEIQEEVLGDGDEVSLGGGVCSARGEEEEEGHGEEELPVTGLWWKWP